MILLSQLQDEFTGNDQRLFISQADGLASLNGVDGGVQSRETYHGCQHHVDRASLYDFVECLGSCIYLHVRHVAHQRFQGIITCFVGNDNGCGLKLVGLLCQQFHFVIGSQAVYFV